MLYTIKGDSIVERWHTVDNSWPDEISTYVVQGDNMIQVSITIFSYQFSIIYSRWYAEMRRARNSSKGRTKIVHFCYSLTRILQVLRTLIKYSQSRSLINCIFLWSSHSLLIIEIIPIDRETFGEAYATSSLLHLSRTVIQRTVSLIFFNRFWII